MTSKQHPSTRIEVSHAASPGLSREQRAAIDQPIEHAAGLPGECYTSAEWARIERETVLASAWTCVGYCHDLALGGVRPVDLLGLPLVIVRDDTGNARVFHNVCRHRGHRLVTEEGVRRKVIRCPYHSWTYGLDGSLHSTPHIGGHGQHQCADFDIDEHSLWVVRSATWMGMVFVNLDGSGPEFSTHVVGLEQRWSSFTGVGGLNNLEAVGKDGSLELEFHANWKLAIENYCESYHLPWVHPGLNRYSHIDDHYNIVGGEWGAGQGTYKFTFSERAGIELPIFDQWPKDKSTQAEYVALFPNVLLGLHIDHFYSVIVQPLAHNRTRELLQIYYVGDSVADDKHARARREILSGWRAVFEEDIRPVEEMQRGRDSTAFDGGAFSPVLDTATHHFHRWVAARYPQVA